MYIYSFSQPAARQLELGGFQLAAPSPAPPSSLRPIPSLRPGPRGPGPRGPRGPHGPGPAHKGPAHTVPGGP